jgi:hypothetical protein
VNEDIKYNKTNSYFTSKLNTSLPLLQQHPSNRPSKVA